MIMIDVSSFNIKCVRKFLISGITPSVLATFFSYFSFFNVKNTIIYVVKKNPLIVDLDMLRPLLKISEKGNELNFWILVFYEN